jgi:arabinofuranan 3-O-arabinosyltransferase
MAPQWWTALGYALLAAITYLPLQFALPGTVAADTKTYLYLDPGRVLARAQYMWDEHIGMGTVTHQYIGYLFPMGPFYWVMQALHVPDPVAQRLWLGTILFAAACGVLYLCRTLALRGAGAPIAALAYTFSPYVLDYAARISVMLLPFAGLPWLLAFTIRGLRRGGWRYPALFAITVQLIGGVNATSLLLVGLGPVLWIAYATWVTREVAWKRALGVAIKIGGLTLLASLWWMSGLWAQGKYGIDVLRFTETVKAVAKTSAVPEIVRGLGYWFFYGQDKLGPWVESSADYTQHLWLIGLSFLLPALAMTAIALVRWKYTAFFVGLVMLGVVIGVGAHPYDRPSPFGGLLKAFADSSSAGLALRSTARAVPLLVLALAVLLGVLVTAGAARLAQGSRPWLAPVAVGTLGVLVLANFPALWNGHFYANNLTRPAEVPQYWKDAAQYLDAQSHDTRVLELPGADFASYRWGSTVDPITPGLLDRPYVARELIPYGTPPSADLLNAVDRRLQEGTFEPAGLAPMARFMGVGDVVLRNDLQVDRYNLVRPAEVWKWFTPSPAGFGTAVSFGSTIPGRLRFPLIDEQALGRLAGAPDPAPVVVVPVQAPQSIVRLASPARSVVLAGSGDGLVNAAGAGLVNGSEVVLNPGSFPNDAAHLRALAGPSAALVLTDTNRKQSRRWTTVADNLGVTETVDEVPLVADPGDARLDIYPGAGTDAQTVMQQRGVARVTATAYGNPISNTPEDRPARALDGDVTTAWRVGAFEDAVGQRWQVELGKPITTSSVNLVQPVTGTRNRWITRATLRFDGGQPVTVALGDQSRLDEGQTVSFPARTFSKLEIRIDATNTGTRLTYDNQSSVGFAEVRIRPDGAASDVRVDEVVRMPTDLMAAYGADNVAHPLTVLMDRQWVRPVPPRYDEEFAMARVFTLPTPRGFGLSATARLNPDAPDDVLDTVLGYPGVDAGGIRATSSEHLAGDVGARASSAFDGDPTTAWVSPFVMPGGKSVTVTAAQPVTFDHLDLRVVADGRHSVPTRLRIDAGGETRVIDVPAVADGATPNATVSVPVAFAPLSGDTVTITIEDTRKVWTLETFSRKPVVMPVAVAEFGVPGVRRGAASGTAIPSACRSDLVTVQGQGIAMRPVGERTVVASGSPFTLEPCAGAVAAPSGDVEVRGGSGRATGINVDRIVMASAVGGGAASPGPVAMGDGAVPALRVTQRGPVSTTAVVDQASAPFWFVLGQSNNAGWKLRVRGGTASARTLVDGYANGWLITPDAAGGPVRLQVEWMPQRVVFAAIGISALTLLACLAIVLASWVLARRRVGLGANGADIVMPTLRNPFRADAEVQSLTMRGLIVRLVLAAFVSWFVAGLVPALVLGAAAVVLGRWPRYRWYAPIASAALILGCGLTMMVQQFRYQYPPVFEWPTFFPALNAIGWIAILLLPLPWLLTPRPRRRPRPRPR